jgi:hypothetical protein
MTRHRYAARSQHATQDQKAPGTRCTCTGGPYVHGPEGLRLAFQQIEDIQQTEGDTDDE